MKKIFLFLILLIFIGGKAIYGQTTANGQDTYINEVEAIDYSVVDTNLYYEYEAKMDDLGYSTSYNPEVSLYVDIIDPDPFYVSVYSPYYYYGYTWGYYNPYFYNGYYPYYYYGFGWYSPWFYMPCWGYGWGYYGPYYGNSYWGHTGYLIGHRGYNYNGRENSLTHNSAKNARTISQKPVQTNQRSINNQSNTKSYTPPTYRQAKSSNEYTRSKNTTNQVPNNRYIPNQKQTQPAQRTQPVQQRANPGYNPQKSNSTPVRSNSYSTPTRTNSTPVRSNSYTTPTRSNSYSTPTRTNSTPTRSNSYSSPQRNSTPSRSYSPGRSAPSRSSGSYSSPSRSSGSFSSPSRSSGGGSRSGGGGRK